MYYILLLNMDVDYYANQKQIIFNNFSKIKNNNFKKKMIDYVIEHNLLVNVELVDDELYFHINLSNIWNVEISKICTMVLKNSKSSIII